jgi:hypothetical protein
MNYAKLLESKEEIKSRVEVVVMVQEAEQETELEVMEAATVRIKLKD